MSDQATEWLWVVIRVDGMGDMIAETNGVPGDSCLKIRRRLGLSIHEEGGVGQFVLHVDRTPQLDLLQKIAPEIAVYDERIVFVGWADPKAVALAEQALGEGKRIVPANDGDIEKAARVFKGPGAN